MSSTIGPLVAAVLMKGKPRNAFRASPDPKQREGTAKNSSKSTKEGRMMIEVKAALRLTNQVHATLSVTVDKSTLGAAHDDNVVGKTY